MTLDEFTTYVHQNGQRLLAVPAGTQDVRAAQVARLERHHDLRPDCRQDLQALVVVGVRREQRGPGADRGTVVREPREPELDPAQAVGVDDRRDDRRVDAKVAEGPTVGTGW